MSIQERKKWIWNKRIAPTLIILIVLIATIIGIKKRESLNNNTRYTIGITIKTYWTAASGKWVYYSYTVNNEVYYGSNNYNDVSQVPGGRYYVKFDKTNIAESIILQDKTVPGSIKTAPKEGWEKIPESDNPKPSTAEELNKIFEEEAKKKAQ